jgi:hypothetical protein
MYIIHGASAKQTRLIHARPNVDLRLSFVQQEVIGNLIFRLDKLRKRLVISHVFDPSNILTLIDICKVKSFSIKKEFSDIQPGASIRRNADFLNKIFFRFEFSDNNQILCLPVFELHDNNHVEIENVEKKAVRWQLLLSKLKWQ